VLCGWWPYAVRLSRHGFRVLIFDLRCYGLSSCPQNGADDVASDIHAAVNELRRRGAFRIGLVGASFGGSAVVVAGAQDRRVVAIADLSGDENEVAMSRGKRSTAATAASGVRQPALVALARNDPYVTITQAKRLYAALAGNRKRFVLLRATAGHGWDMLQTASGGWSPFEHTLTSFLRRHLR
jgi:dienelactone hydrolase